MLLKLGWRNLWRQKRRTFLTAFALALALFLSLLTRSLQEGTYSANIDNAARFYTGLIQLQHPEFEESLSIDDVIPGSGEVQESLLANPGLETVLPRIESFALAAANDKSKGVLVMGVKPDQENRYSGISEKLVEGEYLQPHDQQILIGEGVADYFDLQVGDELVLYGQGYRGQTAAGLYPVKGILHYPISQLDSQIVYLPLALAQELYSTGDLITSWVLHTKDLRQQDALLEQLNDEFGDSLNVRSWENLAPEMAQQIMMDKAGGVFMIYVLYGVVGFGLFATVLMMTLERQREFAVMLATGMLRLRLLQLIIIESALLAVLGIALGLLLSTPVLVYFYYNPIVFTGETAQLMIDSGFEPIMPVSLAPYLVVDQVLAVTVLLAICLIYPLYRIYKLNVVNALKGGAHAY